MFGPDWEAHSLDATPTISSGIIPSSISTIFTLALNSSIYCSFLQIYNEKIFDLLQDPNREHSLKIREKKAYGIFVEGLAEYIVSSQEHCFALLAQGDKNRVVRQTKMNYNSSRSHTIFQLLVENDKADSEGMMVRGKLNFCDLAGSEKFDKSSSTVHIREMSQINKSLSTLGKVIYALAQAEVHIPYRESKLTRLIQDSLGSRTVLIATISPNYIDETISTLKFADRAKQVMVVAKKNEISAINNELIMKLQREIQHLRSLLQLRRNKNGVNELEHQLWALKEENLKLKRYTSNMSVEQVEQLKEENKQLRLHLQTTMTEYSEPEALCEKCKLTPPCVHYANPIALSNRESGAATAENVVINSFPAKFRLRNMESTRIVSDEGKRDTQNKEIRRIYQRLNKIAQLEEYRKEKFRKQFEVLEETKKREDVQRNKRVSSFKSIKSEKISGKVFADRANRIL